MNSNTNFDITQDRDTVRILQNMLRLISQAEGNLPLIGEDGIYDEGMHEAVRQYQELRRLPVTGVVDPITWDYIANDYERILEENRPPMMISPFPSILGYRIDSGETSDLVLIMQIMLSALSLIYDGLGNVPLSGVYDTRTTAAVRRFRAKNLLPPENYVDLDTWNRLARQYNLYVNRSQ